MLGERLDARVRTPGNRGLIIVLLVGRVVLGKTVGVSKCVGLEGTWMEAVAPGKRRFLWLRGAPGARSEGVWGGG